VAFITVDRVSKNYRILKNKPGVWGALISLFHREYLIKKAVEDLSFSLERGEIVGYIGPNGAGKSTTLKMLSGVLTPDRGTITVGGIVPGKDRKKNARHIGVVFGQRSQLYWDLPILDTFSLYQKLYAIPPGQYRANKERLTELLDMGDFIEQPVRQLSLGQKMKANLALALLHDPDVLYLDEPTIGLDVMSKQALRQSILAINREKNTTIILTTHDMNDIEAVCKRLILIDKGRKLFDGSLEDFTNRYEDAYVVQLAFTEFPVWEPRSGYTLQSESGSTWTIRVDRGISSKEALTTLIGLYNLNMSDISVKKQDIEDMVRRIFSKEGLPGGDR
jgi:ABC-2 type transport system ATP-binding protein